MMYAGSKLGVVNGGGFSKVQSLICLKESVVLSAGV